ncbi:MAG TPA: hypothetical protein V6C72_09850 [Chroococcales cyanobacterium]
MEGARARQAGVKTTLAVLSLSILLGAAAPSWARGGGGGGGRGFGGGFDRGGFDRGFGGDDFGNRADQFLRGGDDRPYAGTEDRAYDRSNDFSDARADAFNGGARASESELRAGADQTYGNYGQRALATDGGLGSVASTYGGAYGGAYRAGALGHYTTPLNGTTLNTYGNALRDGYHNYGLYDRDWWGAHPYGWRYPYWPNDWAYGYTGWPALAGFWGVSGVDEPGYYDYGTDITYQGDNVYYGSQPVESAEQYYGQAQQLAVAATPTPATKISASEAKGYKPLGVFSLAQPGQKDTTALFQLAVNKQGIIRGNYTDVLSGETKTVQGSVDKKKMRAAWTVGTNKSVVYDTGVSNLLQKQAPILVHFGPKQTQQFLMVRMDPPKKA